MNFTEAKMLQEEKIYLELKKNMQGFDKDFYGALRRSEEIAEAERIFAEQEVGNLEILESFGVVL